MGLLDFDDTYKPPFKARQSEPKRDNFKDLQNLGYENEVKEEE